MNAESGNFVRDLAASLSAEPEAGSPADACAVLAARLVDLYREGKTQHFETVFNIVEQYVIFGSEEDKKLAMVGFLENVKNYCVMTDLDYVVFEEWIGPETYQAWRWLEKRWQGRRSLASVADGIEDKPLRLGKKKPE